MSPSEVLIYGAGVVSFVNLLWFARNMWYGKAAVTNTASWAMWFALDLSALAMMIADKKPFMLTLGYTIGAAVVLGVHVAKGGWKWTWVEMVSALGVAASVGFWLALDSLELGTIAYLTAMTIAGIPLLTLFAKTPDRNAFWVFANTVIACSLHLLGAWPVSSIFSAAPAWTIVGDLIGITGFIFNGIIAILVLRAPRKATQLFTTCTANPE